MSKKTIPYVSGTINPVSGCTRFSRGCDRCYGFTWATRFRKGDFSLKYFPEKLDIIRRKKSGLWFVGSMTDLFQDEIPFGWVELIMQRIVCSPAKFLVLTKRAERMAMFFSMWPAPANLGIGVTAEGQAEWDERVPILLGIKAPMHFVSVEPMLEEVQFNGRADGLSWVIAGPETGAGKRLCEPEWLVGLESECEISDLPFFDKRESCWKHRYTRQWPEGWGI